LVRVTGETRIFVMVIITNNGYKPIFIILHITTLPINIVFYTSAVFNY
jgi:hypothetical protein